MSNVKCVEMKKSDMRMLCLIQIIQTRYMLGAYALKNDWRLCESS